MKFLRRGRSAAFIVFSFLLMAAYQNCAKNVDFQSKGGGGDFGSLNMKLSFSKDVPTSGLVNQPLQFNVTRAWLENTDTGATEPITLETNNVTWNVLDAEGNIVESAHGQTGSMEFSSVATYSMEVVVRHGDLFARNNFSVSIFNDSTENCLPPDQSFSIAGAAIIGEDQRELPQEYRILDFNSRGGPDDLQGRCYRLMGGLNTIVWSVLNEDMNKALSAEVLKGGNPSQIVFRQSQGYIVRAEFNVQRVGDMTELPISINVQTRVLVNYDEDVMCPYDFVTADNLICSVGDPDRYEWSCRCESGSVGFDVNCWDKVEEKVVSSRYCGGIAPSLNCPAVACMVEKKGSEKVTNKRSTTKRKGEGDPMEDNEYYNQTVNCRIQDVPRDVVTSDWKVDIHVGDTIREESITKQFDHLSVNYLLNEIGEYTFSTKISMRGCSNTKEIRMKTPINTGATACDLNPRSCQGADTHMWIDAACSGQCIQNPWWKVNNGHICIRKETGAPDNPYNESLCGPVPEIENPLVKGNPFETPPIVACPTVCSPWGQEVQ